MRQNEYNPLFGKDKHKQGKKIWNYIAICILIAVLSSIFFFGALTAPEERRTHSKAGRLDAVQMYTLNHAWMSE